MNEESQVRGLVLPEMKLEENPVWPDQVEVLLPLR